MRTMTPRLLMIRGVTVIVIGFFLSLAWIALAAYVWPTARGRGVQEWTRLPAHLLLWVPAGLGAVMIVVGLVATAWAARTRTAGGRTR